TIEPMKPILTCAALALAAAPALALPPLEDLAAHVSEPELHATIERLVAFGTRHTLSDTRSDTRGIGAARRWVQSRFDAISRDCGGCLQIVTPAQIVTGQRIPQPAEVMNIVAIQRVSDDPSRMVLITGHLDTR